METAPPWVAGLWRGGERNEGIALETMADGDAAAAFAAGLFFLEDHPAARAAWSFGCLVTCLVCLAINVALATGMLRW